MSYLQSLQNFVSEQLKTSAALKCAQITVEKFEFVEEFSNTNGLRISVGIPVPSRVSKYSAGAIFADVAFEIKLLKKNISAAAPALLSLCECACKCLHNWTPPVESGYGKISIVENSPWKIEKSDANETLVCVKFHAQSLLQ